MIKLLISFIITIGFILKPIVIYCQYVNSAIHIDTFSAESAISLLQHRGKPLILGALKDTSAQRTPLLFFSDSLNEFKTFKRIFHQCETLTPIPTNQLGQQNGHYYFLANCNPSYNKFEIYKILIDNLGDTVSTYRINNNDTSLARRSHFLPNGQMILLGQNPSEYFVQKWDGDSLLWTYQSDVNQPIILNRILIDGDNIVVSGRIGIYNNNPGSDLFIAKLNKDGQLLWDLRKDLGESEVMGGLAKFNGEYVISFTKAPWINWPNHDLKTYLGVVDNSGNWDTYLQVGNEGRSKIVNFLINSGENLIYIAGEHNLDFNRRESIFYKLNNDFEIQWERRYLFEDDTKHSSNIWDARIEPDSTIKTIGVLYNGPGGQDLWYLHLDKHGCLTPGCEVNDVSVEEVFWGNDRKLSVAEVYPNPAQTILNLKFTETNSGQVFIYNVQSVLVKQQTFEQSQNISIDVANLPNGMYFLHIKTKSGAHLVKKFVVNAP